MLYHEKPRKTPKKPEKPRGGSIGSENSRTQMGWLTLVVSAVKLVFSRTSDVFLGYQRPAVNQENVIRQYIDYYNLPNSADDIMRGEVGKINEEKTLSVTSRGNEAQF